MDLREKMPTAAILHLQHPVTPSLSSQNRGRSLERDRAGRPNLFCPELLFHENNPGENFIGCPARGPRQSANNRDRTFCPRSRKAFREESHTRTFWRWLMAMSVCIVEAVLEEKKKKQTRGQEKKKEGTAACWWSSRKVPHSQKLSVVGQGF